MSMTSRSSRMLFGSSSPNSIGKYVHKRGLLGWGHGRREAAMCVFCAVSGNLVVAEVAKTMLWLQQLLLLLMMMMMVMTMTLRLPSPMTWRLCMRPQMSLSPATMMARQTTTTTPMMRPWTRCSRNLAVRWSPSCRSSCNDHPEQVQEEDHWFLFYGFTWIWR